MSSPTLFKIAGGIFLLFPIGHTQMALQLLNPGLSALGASPAAFASKVSWNQANGYFITTGLLCLNWANKGVQGTLEKYILAVLLATQSITGFVYLRKGVLPPMVAYWTTSLLMGIAALKEA